MVVQSSNRSDSRETFKETPYVHKNPGCRGGKLLEDALREARAPSLQNPCRLLLGGADSRNITIERLQGQLAKLT